MFRIHLVMPILTEWQSQMVFLCYSCILYVLIPIAQCQTSRKSRFFFLFHRLARFEKEMERGHKISLEILHQWSGAFCALDITTITSEFEHAFQFNWKQYTIEYITCIFSTRNGKRRKNYRGIKANSLPQKNFIQHDNNRNFLKFQNVWKKELWMFVLFSLPLCCFHVHIIIILMQKWALLNGTFALAFQ